MDNKSEKKDETLNNKEDRKHYIRPEIESEDLMVFAAVCNGTQSGGRKANAVDCNQRKLNS